jgi:shikimate kinase
MKTGSIVLIGMAGVGKSTVGRLIARNLGYDFIDGDDYICQKDGRPLQDILDALGDTLFCELEKKLMLEIDFNSPVVLAPGGSVVYHSDLMEYFKANSVLVYLDDTIENIESRLPNATRRGIVGLRTRTLRQIYTERKPLYGRWADLTLACNTKTPEELAAEILQHYREWNSRKTRVA